MHHLYCLRWTDPLAPPPCESVAVLQAHDCCSGSCWLDIVPLVHVQYHCKAEAHPGDECRKGKPKGICEKPSEYDHECKCRKNFKSEHTVMHSKILSRPHCDLLACSAICCISAKLHS